MQGRNSVWMTGVLLWAGLAVGCGGGGVTPAAQGTAAPAQAGGTAAVRIVNASNESIYYIYMSRTSESTWGPDQLGNQVLGRGQAFTMNVPVGTWDLRVEDASGNYKEWRNQRIDAGGAYDLQVDSDGWNR